MSITFYLYRLKIRHPDQSDMLIDRARKPSEVISNAIGEKPSKEIRKGYTWHIGNIEPLGENGLSFALGCVTKSIVEKFDEEEGNFREEPDEQAPYTYAIVDLKYQICALAHKPKIAPRVSQLARNLEKLLNETQEAVNNKLIFNMAEIKDPTKFVEYIRDAVAIEKFNIEFTPPNPWDVEEEYHKPMEKLLENTQGSQGKTFIKGESLEKGAIEKLAISAASTGDNASATMKTKDGEIVTKNIKGNQAIYITDEVAEIDKKKVLWNEIVKKYRDIRNSGAEE